MKVYVCPACGLVYDEAAGLPEHGIPAGTPWAQVPASWRCPECNVGKQDFVPMDR
ncbi:rubredoxin [Azohydromonas lata]|uniref:Rubredoxin n=1 Tax=Azohydromonas lata TaxID=45677 RepID=A0ABU5ICF1_9BURK|nr:rubredoxin [Azohydromonas lata]MDZ5456790.1 rubredoxin [Azohydromonas lata]